MELQKNIILFMDEGNKIAFQDKWKSLKEWYLEECANNRKKYLCFKYQFYLSDTGDKGN